MSRYAIDVVILPPVPVMDLAIKWNRALPHAAHQSILLNKIDVLPHISLLMGCVTEQNLLTASVLLNRIGRGMRQLELEVTGLQFTEDSHPVAALDIFLTPQLLELQQLLIEQLGPLITQDTVEEDLYDAPPDSASAVKWINSFIPDQCGMKLWPHITLGHGRMEARQERFSFIPERLAICHLGKHCTCRKVLGSVKFPGVN